MSHRPDVSAGWQRRVLGLTGGAGLTGAGVGSLLALLYAAPISRYAVGTAASCALAGATFASLCEAARAARCADTPLNSGLAGGGAGYALTVIHTGSPARGAGVGLVAAPLAAAAAAATAHLGGRRGILRPLLESTGLLDLDADARAERAAAEVAATVAAVEAASQPLPFYLRWLPIQRLTPDEVAAHAAKKASGEQAARATAAAGGLLAVVAKKEK